ncbi:unnamed protein product [Scytosiphon promiscuus]
MLLRSWALAVILSAMSISGTISSSSDLMSSLHSSFPPMDEDLGGCILLFGAYANGNMGDVVQSSTMSRLVSNVAPGTCIWHAHPSKESTTNGFHEGEFFAKNSAGLVSLGCDRESGQQVSRFKAFFIGGGGIFESRHWPLDCEDFVDGLGDVLPVAIFGVGASEDARVSAPIIRRANFLSGRDEKSVRELSALVSELENTRSRPEDVRRVRDPVLSDSYFTDFHGKCWRERNSGTERRPLCFVLPSAMKENLQEMHQILSSQIVHIHDVLLNVFPKHQAEIEAYPYHARVEQVLDPADYAMRLCDCRAVIASRLHGAILALQAGVPVVAAWPENKENKVPDLMNDVMRLHDQFVIIDKTFTRRDLERKVREVRQRYSSGRRNLVFEKLGSIALHTQQECAHVLTEVAHFQLPQAVNSSTALNDVSFWGEPDVEPELDGDLGEVTGTESEEIFPPIELNQEGREVKGAASPWSRLTKTWKWKRTAAASVVGGELSFAGSIYLAWMALAMIAVLGWPRMAPRSRRGLAPTPHESERSFALGKGSGLNEEGNEVSSCPQEPACGSPVGQNTRRISIATIWFFGLNYISWIVLSLGFSICSKTYMRETRNPIALLAIQGWIGVGVLCATNFLAWHSRRGRVPHFSTFSPSSCPPTSPDSDSDSTASPSPSPSSLSSNVTLLSLGSSSSEPSWTGKCGLREARRLGHTVWQAGLLHSGNAVLTSWSILIGGVAATHALKALEPVAAAGFSRWLLGSSLPPGRAAAVAIIVLGLGILMMPSHLPQWVVARGGGSYEGGVGKAEDLAGPGQDLAYPAIISACACCAVALRNVLLKKEAPRPPPPPLGLLACSIVGTVVGSMILLVPWLPCSWEWAGQPLLRASGVNAALCFVGYNLASFNLLAELSPVGHAIGNASKRICLFASGYFLLGEEESMSPRQLAGALVALVGLASYNLTGARFTYALPLAR